MRPLAALILCLVACSTPRVRPVAAPIDPVPASWNRVVATMNGEEIRYRDILESAADGRLDVLLRHHVLKRIVEAKKREHGIKIDDEEIRRLKVPRARLENRRIVARDLQASEWARIDLTGYETEAAAKKGKDPAVRIDGLRFCRGAMAADLGTPFEDSIFTAAAGNTLGPVRDRSGLWAVIRLTERFSAGQRVPETPPTEAEIKVHFDWLFRLSNVKVRE